MQEVVGSIPTSSTIFNRLILLRYFLRSLAINWRKTDNILKRNSFSGSIPVSSPLYFS